MRNPSRIQMLVLGGPDAAGGRALLARVEAAARAGTSVRMLLSGAGLAWTAEPDLVALASLPGVEVALCSRSARDEGYEAASLPPRIHWSSLLRWLLDRDPSASLWGLMP